MTISFFIKIIVNTVLTNGVDNYMDEVESVADIWDVVRRRSLIPQKIKIKLSDGNNGNYGCLYLFDLPSLPFVPPSEVDNRTSIYNSFLTLNKYLHEKQRASDIFCQDINNH